MSLLFDPTPSNQLRSIRLNHRRDRVAGTAKVPDGGIIGCATRELRFAADQDGGQRLSGELNRVTTLPQALPADQIVGWQTRTFG